MSYEHYIPITTITSAWFSPGKGPRDRTVLRAIRIMHKEAATVQGPLENGGWPKRNHGFPIENGCLVPSRGLPVKKEEQDETSRVSERNYGSWKSKARECDPKNWVQPIYTHTSPHKHVDSTKTSTSGWGVRIPDLVHFQDGTIQVCVYLLVQEHGYGWIWKFMGFPFENDKHRINME